MEKTDITVCMALLVLSVVALVGTSCGPAPTFVPTPTATAYLPRLSGPIATYTDTEIGYAFDYPASWYLHATPGWTIIISSHDLSSPGQREVPPDWAKVDLQPDKPAQNKTLEALVKEVKAGSPAGEVQVLWEEPWTLAEGVPAVRMQVVGEAGGEMALLLTVINGRSLRLVGYGNLDLFDAIARTLRPIPLSEFPSFSSTATSRLSFMSGKQT